MTTPEKAQLALLCEQFKEVRASVAELPAVHEKLKNINEKLDEVIKGGTANCAREDERIKTLEKISEAQAREIRSKASKVNIAGLWAVVSTVGFIILSVIFGDMFGWIRIIH